MRLGSWEVNATTMDALLLWSQALYCFGAFSRLIPLEVGRGIGSSTTLATSWLTFVPSVHLGYVHTDWLRWSWAKRNSPSPLFFLWLLTWSYLEISWLLCYLQGSRVYSGKLGSMGNSLAFLRLHARKGSSCRYKCGVVPRWWKTWWQLLRWLLILFTLIWM